jgi:uncharacterized protein (DUF849 family)
METFQKKFILNFTPTGMIPTKEMTPFVPIEPKEIIAESLEMAELGANMIHLHARDDEGVPTYQKEIYGEIVSGIRRHAKDVVLCVSTSGRNFSEFEKRSECLELTGDAKPDFGSLTLSSLNFNKQASVNSPQMIQMLAKKMLDQKIKPELEVFDLGMINYARYLIKKQLIKGPHYFNLILGNIACAQASLMNLGLMVRDLPQNSKWAAGGIGDHQITMNAMALVAGGGVRVGIEDNIFYDREKNKKATNRELVERVLDIAKSLGREPYSHKEARSLICY